MTPSITMITFNLELSFVIWDSIKYTMFVVPFLLQVRQDGTCPLLLFGVTIATSHSQPLFWIVYSKIGRFFSFSKLNSLSFVNSYFLIRLYLSSATSDTNLWYGGCWMGGWFCGGMGGCWEEVHVGSFPLLLFVGALLALVVLGAVCGWFCERVWRLLKKYKFLWIWWMGKVLVW